MLCVTIHINISFIRWKCRNTLQLQERWNTSAIALRLIRLQVRFINTLRPRQNRRHFPDDIFKCIFLNENVCISINISLKFVPNGPINYIPALVQITAWRGPGDKPLSEPMMISLLTHICITRPQWVNQFHFNLRTKLENKSNVSQNKLYMSLF